MHKLSKVVLSSSLVLGAALFSIGCGGDGSCCDGEQIDAKVGLLASNNLSNGTLPLNINTLTVNGMDSKTDGTITQAVWTAYANCTKDTPIDTKTVATKDTEVTLDLGAPGQHKVCVVVTDTNGLKDEDCECITVQELDGPSAKITGLAQTLKVGCPLPGATGITSTTNSGSNNLTYAWTLDGANAGTNVTPNLPSTLTATPNPHEVCLTVTDSNLLHNEQCQNINIVPHDKPTAVLAVWNEGDTTKSLLNVNDHNLSRGNTYSLSCGTSHDDCPQDAEDLTCTWDARSYLVTGTDCSATPQTDYISDCFVDEGGHTGSAFTKVTTTSTPTAMQLCGADNSNYKCVEFKLTVRDNLHNTVSDPVTKTFIVAP